MFVVVLYLMANFNDIICESWAIVPNHLKKYSKMCHSHFIYKPYHFFSRTYFCSFYEIAWRQY
jgi:hypothetical protein